MKRFSFVRTGLLAASGLALAVAAPAIVPPAAAATFTIDIPNCQAVSATGNGSTISINCTTVSAPPPTTGGTAPSSCTASASPSALGSGGGAVSLSVSCAGGSAATGVAWSKNGAAFGALNGFNQSDTLAANAGSSAATYTYVATVSNSYGSSTATAIVSVAGTTSSGGGTVGGTLTCSGYAKTLVMDLPWSTSSFTPRQYTTGAGGMGPNDALVVRINVPAGVVSTAPGTFSMAEFGGGPVQRFATLTQTPCDFNRSNWGVDAFIGTTISFGINVGKVSPYIVTLQAGQQYYLNVRNTDRYGNPTGGGCDNGVCNMAFDLFKPAGT